MEPPPCFHNVFPPAASRGKIAEVAKRVVTTASLVCDFFVTSFRLTSRQRRCRLLRTVTRKELSCLPLLLWMSFELRLTTRRPSSFSPSALANGRVWQSWDSLPVK